MLLLPGDQKADGTLVGWISANLHRIEAAGAGGDITMHLTAEKPIVVRQRPLMFLAFVAGGVLFLVFPWTLDLQAPIWMRLFWTALGLMVFTVGIVGFKFARIGMAIDQQGIWLLGWSMPPRLLLVSWDEIEGVRILQWTDPKGDHEGIVLGVGPEAFAAITKGRVDASRRRKAIEEHLGLIPWEYPILLEHSEWIWSPKSVVAAIDECVREPSSRSLLGALEPDNR